MSYMGPGAASLANVAGTTSSVGLFPAASHSSGRVVYNDSTAVLYLAFGGSASSSSYTVQVAAGGFYEFPVPVYAGTVSGAWVATAGTARTTWW